jgi:hypothetical protein
MHFQPSSGGLKVLAAIAYLGGSLSSILPASAQMSMPQTSVPQTSVPQAATSVSDQVPIDLAQFQRRICANGLAGTGQQDVDLSGPTIPSLWWTRELLSNKPQFNPKLIEAWLVCDAGRQNADARVCGIGAARPGRVEMIVNTQLWSVMDYLSRYELINRFGTATSECGYNIYIYSSDAKLLADYTCDFQSIDISHRCVLRADLSGKSGLRRGGTDIPIGVPAPTGNNTAAP